MSQDETSLSRKDKKALRDAERAQQKGKKRKLKDVAEPDALPGQDDDEDNDVPETAIAEPAPKAPRKRKAGELFTDTTADPSLVPDSTSSTTAEPAAAAAGAAAAAQPRKKRRKTAKQQPTDGTPAPEAPKKSRFIVFVGNLPYKTTDSSLQKHFAKLQPFTLRHRVDPKTQKSKGFAFLEFENYDRMKTCLKVFHHSLFDPEAIDRGEAVVDPTKVEGKVDDDESGMHPDRRNGAAAAGFRGHGKKKETARRINVELTAGGGGGKSGERKERIREKNVRLNEQRERRAELERKEKAKKDRDGAGKGGKGKSGGRDGKGADGEKKHADENVVGGVEASGDIHPARLAMMGR